MRLVLQTVIDGLINGSVYALLGIGLVLYYRSSRVLNLAHGETFVIGGLVTAWLMTNTGIGFLVSSIAGLLSAVLFSVLMERTLLRSRLDWPMPTLIIVTLGVALVVLGLARVVVGTQPYTFPPLVAGPPFRLLGAVMTRHAGVVLLVTLVAGVSLALFFKRSILGQAMTAVAENPTASSILGIDVGRMRMLSYGLAGFYGGMAAWLVVPISFVAYDRGLTLVLRGFIAAALANMIHPERALLGGLALGVTEALVGHFIDPLLRTTIVFGVFMLAVLYLMGRTVKFGGVARA